jgi:putative SOS response-associated peptidase YedK
MCGRFVVKTDLAQIQLAFELDQVGAEVKPNYNVAPTQPVATVVQHEGERELELMRWGLIPAWATSETIGNRMINARAESVAEKKTFKRLLKSQRCLIVADGFYEWRKDGSRKTPMFIRLKTNEPFAFAGLYDVWKPKEGAPIRSCTILTTTAQENKVLRSIHDRMPVILPKQVYGEWLDPAHQDVGELTALLKPYAAQELEAYPVSSLVNDVKNNSAALIQPVAS